MTSSIDNKTVQMVFDNGAFEARLAETVKSLDGLKKSLDFSNSQKGFADLGKAASSFSVSGMTSAIEGVSSKFLALSTIGITAIAKITTAAIDAGVKIIKAFTLDPIMQGFQEYETNMNSIQTILANTDSKGTTLTQVNDALKQLNEYSDQTIYNFGEMARNIGTFTAAGVDLDTSVNSIKGIANVAAISGSNSQQAATAMYQLSQAIATGSVKLMDWNSVVNAGMGGEVFQKALFETGKSLGTIADTPIGTTFEEWTAGGNSFRGSLEQGWLTSEVLTNTLQGFTGDLTEAQILSMGYTQEQAQEIMRLGALGKAAATEVKTLTQLMSTIKESVGSGWSETFKIVIGDFEEAKDLFTGINTAIGGFVGASADARNELLQGWKDMGGRTLLIQALENAFYGLSRILSPIAKAFRSVFPKTTSEELYKITQAIGLFAQKLIPTRDTIEKLFKGFQGFFYAIKIGIIVLKEIAGVFGDVIKAIMPDNAGGGLLDFFANLGSSITNLYGRLLSTQAIPEFFDNITEKILGAIEAVKDFFSGFATQDYSFDSFSGIMETLGQIFEGIKERWSGLFNLSMPDFGAMLGPFEGIFDSIKGVFEEIKTYVTDWFSSLGDEMANAAEEGDYSKVLDTLNVGLLAGITAILGKFLKDGIGVNFGDGLFGKGGIFGAGTVENINKAFGTLTGTMQAMQTNIKAEALMKIAAAIAILTASVLVLSLIDSAALTKALTAMAVGFGQLVGSMMIITKMDMGPASAAKMSLIAGGMIALAAAILILSIAVKILSTMSWTELAKGLGGVVVLLTALSLAAKPLSANAGGLMRAGLAMIPLALAINLLAVAMKIFATMSWEDIGKGLVGVAGSLLIIAGAMQLMPATLPITAAGLLLVGIALNAIAASMLIFALLDWEEIGKGLVGIGGSLLVIAGAMQLMPATLPITAAGLILVGISLGLIGAAMAVFGNMEWDEIGRGLVAMAGALVILALATTAMSGSLLGAAAIATVAFSMGLLVKVVKEFAGLSWQELAMGLGALAATLAVLGIAALLLAPAVIPMMALGVALIAIGAGFALFGLGVSLVAKGIEVLAKAGKAGVEVFLASLEAILTTLPKIAKAAAEALLEFMTTFLEGVPVILEQLGVIILQLLETLKGLIPVAMETIGVLVTSFLDYIITVAPKFVEAGFTLLTAFLTGLRNNIGAITTLVVEIITKFLDTLATKVPQIIDSVYGLIWAVITGVIAKLVSVATALLPKGLELIGGLLQGITDKAPEVLSWFTELPGKILGWIGDVTKTVLDKGIDFITGLLGGIVQKAVEVIKWFTELPGKTLTWIGAVVTTLLQKGKDFIQGIITGVTEKAIELMTWVKALPGKIKDGIVDAIGTLVQKGKDFIIGLLNGAKEVFETVKTWISGLPGRMVTALGNIGSALLQVGKDVINGLWQGMQDMWDNVTGWLSNLNPANWFNDINPYKGHAIKNLVGTGEEVMLGLQNGMQNGWGNITGWLQELNPANELDQNMSTSIFEAINSAMSDAARMLEDMDDFNPTITPVLDLTNVQRDAKAITDLVGASSALTPTISYAQASTIAATRTELESDTGQTSSGNVMFEQNIYAPRELSVADIYRQTRNQITLAKEELSIP